MKTLLVPLDGTQPARQLLERGLVPQDKESLRILLLHCLDFNFGLVSSGAQLMPKTYAAVVAQQREFGRKYLERQAEELRKLGYASVEVVLLSGDPVRAILDVAEKEQATAILMGTHVRSGLARFFMGSVTEGVIRRSCLPVFIVPPEPELPADHAVVGDLVL